MVLTAFKRRPIVRTTNQVILLYADYVTYVDMLHVNKFFLIPCFFLYISFHHLSAI